MSLRTKIILILSCVVGLYTVFDNGVLRFMASKSFESWEREEARKSFQQVVGLIDDETKHLESKCRMWCGWEGIRRFVATQDASFAEENLGAAALGYAEVDLVYLIDSSGSVIWSRAETPGSDEPIAIREFPSGALDKSSPLRSHLSDDGVRLLGADDSVSGLMITSAGAMLVCSYAVGGGSTSQSGNEPDWVPPRLIMGRFFDQELRAAIGDRATVQLEIEGLDQARFKDGEEWLRDEITSSSDEIVFHVGQDDLLYLYETLTDVYRRPSILLTASVERTIKARGDHAVKYALLSTVATAMLILLALLRLLQRIVIRPIGVLTSNAVEVGKTDDTSVRFGMDRKDEIGILSNEFDRMLGKLAASREEVVKTARRAGMSEIATGVLHNVGNVLNSVNVSANLVTKKAEQLAVKDLERMVGVLQEHEADLGEFVTKHPKGKHMLSFMVQVSSNLKVQQDGMREELQTLGEGIEHIADLVRSQQSYAGTKGVFEMASLATQVDGAIKMCNQAYDEFSTVELERDFESIPQIPVDKHKLMEVLVNLLQNARQALMESGRSDKRIILRVRAKDAETVAIEIEDNGTGIAPENLTRIFHHGFTTKADGHGFGLHVSANAAAEMGASLSARSDGPGKGATFAVTFPIKTLETAHAA